MAASDHAAFRRAIAADPADLTSRLVYADFLEETGEPPHVARAEFIRVQIEADGLPPTDPRRISLERQAAKLFREHWVAWWLPVCALVGLPMPHVPGNRLRERVTRALGRGREPGDPYRVIGPCRVKGPYLPGRLAPPQIEVEFRRGFPESVDLSGELGEAAVAIRRWADALPLCGLGLHSSMARDWAAIRGEHLANVTSLGLIYCNTDVVRGALGSPHMARVDELELRFDRAARPDWPVEQLAVLAGSLVAPRLRRLVVELGSPGEAVVLARPGAWPSLSELVVHSGLPLGGAGGEMLGDLLTVLAGADFLGGLESLGLYLDGPLSGDDGAPVVGPAVEAGLLRLLRALDPGRLRFLGLNPILAYLPCPAVSELVAERFGGKVVAP